MKIVLDAMGGDLAPQINADGAILAAKEFSDLTIILAGPENAVRGALEGSSLREEYEKVRDRIEILDAPEVITPEEHPVMALRKKKQSSFVLGMDLVRNHGADGLSVPVRQARSWPVPCSSLGGSGALTGRPCARWCRCLAARCCWRIPERMSTAGRNGLCSLA